MPPKSESQRRAAAIAEHHPEKAKGAAKEMAKSMSKKQLHDFATTPSKNLPEHVSKEGLDGFLDGYREKQARAGDENAVMVKMTPEEQRQMEALATQREREEWAHPHKLSTEPRAVSTPVAAPASAPAAAPSLKDRLLASLQGGFGSAKKFVGEHPAATGIAAGVAGGAGLAGAAMALKQKLDAKKKKKPVRREVAA
jgi:hypothetical protein